MGAFFCYQAMGLFHGELAGDPAHEVVHLYEVFRASSRRLVIRSLGISADQIFCPERKDQGEQEHVGIQRLYQCLSKRN